MLNFNSQIALLFPNEEIGYLLITLTVISIFISMFIFENKSFSRSKPVKSIYIQKIFNAYQKNLRLFLLTIIPITCIGIVIRLVIIVLTPKYLVIVDMLPFN